MPREPGVLAVARAGVSPEQPVEKKEEEEEAEEELEELEEEDDDDEEEEGEAAEIKAVWPESEDVKEQEDEEGPRSGPFDESMAEEPEADTQEDRALEEQEVSPKDEAAAEEAETTELTAVADREMEIDDVVDDVESKTKDRKPLHPATSEQRTESCAEGCPSFASTTTTSIAPQAEEHRGPQIEEPRTSGRRLASACNWADPSRLSRCLPAPRARSGWGRSRG